MDPRPVDLRIPVGPTHCAARLWPPREGSPAGSFLLLPGLWGDFRRPAYAALCEALRPHGAVLAANLRGHPGSGGWFDFGRTQWQDCGAFYDHLAGAWPGPITAVGFSMGGWLLARYLAERPEAKARTRRLVLCGVPSRLPWVLPRPWRRGLWVQLRHGGKGGVRANPFCLWPPCDLAPSLGALGDLSVSILHAQGDWMVHHSHAERILRALASPPERYELVAEASGLHVEMLALFHRERLLRAALGG